MLINTTNTPATATNFLYKLLLMIEKLFIKNYLIIKEAEIDFSKGLNILTGETGAGKSIILDAMAMILGERADYSLIKKDQDKLVIEGHFNFKGNKKLNKILDKILPEDETEKDYIIVRRELIKKGVSRNFINDNPVNISGLKKFGDFIIDIHSQNEHQSLLSKETHIEILDNFADKKEILKKYNDEFRELKNYVNNYKELSLKKDELISKRSFLDFQLKEINNVNLTEGEDAELETELKKLENVEDISLALDNSVKLLLENEINVISSISVAVKELKKISEFDNSLDKTIEDLENSYILVKESSDTLRSYNNELNFDNLKTEQTRARLSAVNHLKKKYGLTVAELIEKSERLQEELNFADNFDYEIQQLSEKIKEQRKKAFLTAKDISALRIKSAGELEKKINSVMKEIGLESAEFRVEITNTSGDAEDFYAVKAEKNILRLSEGGFNEVEFLINTNKSPEFSPLRKSASGGEISRIMLAIKAAISEKDKIPVLVFDEIDAGISGRTAQKVGKILHKLSETHQIICITHLPQIAAMSDRHFHVSKREDKGSVTAVIKTLNEKEKINEVAKLISGEEVTESATRSAAELING